MALVVGAGSERQIQEDWNSMQAMIPKDFWNELKQKRLIEQNVPTCPIRPLD